MKGPREGEHSPQVAGALKTIPGIVAVEHI
jgi:hypothetical protein